MLNFSFIYLFIFHLFILDLNIHLSMASAVPAFPSTKETTNYARLCRLLVDVGCHALRNRFDQIHSPAGLYTLLSNPAVYMPHWIHFAKREF